TRPRPTAAASPVRRRSAPPACPTRSPLPKDDIMQRWVKLPDGRFIDANKIMYIGKVETFPRIDEDGNALGQGYAVHLGTDIPRENSLTLMGSKEEVLGVLKQVLGSAPAG